jgi:hypothetical protein
MFTTAAQARALAALTPSRAARTAPSTQRLAAALARVALPPTTVALAACLLDALSGAFARSWRAAALAPRRGRRRPTYTTVDDDVDGGGEDVGTGVGAPATPPQCDEVDGGAEHGLPDDDEEGQKVREEKEAMIGHGDGDVCWPRCTAQQQHEQHKHQHKQQWPPLPPPQQAQVQEQQRPQPEEEGEEDDADACVCRASAPPPETVALAALKIAAGFLSDRRVEARWWARWVVADPRVDARDVDLAVRCILVDVDYDLCAFSAEEVEKRRVWMMRGVEDEEEDEEVWRSVAPMAM